MAASPEKKFNDYSMAEAWRDTMAPFRLCRIYTPIDKSLW